MATVRPLCTSPHRIFQNVMSSNGQNGPEWWALLLVETEARRGGVICPKAILQYWQNSGELQAVRLGAPPHHPEGDGPPWAGRPGWAPQAAVCC